MAVFTHKAEIDKIYFLGSKLPTTLRDAALSMELSASKDQVTEISMTFNDPLFNLLNTGAFKIGASVRYQNFNLTVTNLETNGGASPSVGVRCRPKCVQNLKKRTGAKALNNASPSTFVINECKAVGVKYVVQSSPKRKQVARDVRKSGEKYETDQIPSSWTTFQRLASELGYIVFESNDTIFFGKPTWLLSTTKKTAMKVTVKSGGDSTRSIEAPNCTQSIDKNNFTSVQVTLPINRLPEVRVGKGLYLADMPKFKGYYLITAYDVDLAGNAATISVTAETPVDPVAQPPQVEPAPGSDTGSLAGVAGSSGARYTGAWPLPTNYRVTTAFGVRGSWASGYHTGADFACPAHVKCYAVYDGTIIGGGWGSAYGIHTILDVPGRGRYAYCHLSSVAVSAGTKVKAGQVIGYTDSTGRSFGNHLHLEYRIFPYRYGSDSRNPIPTLQKTAYRDGPATSGGTPTPKPSSSNSTYKPEIYGRGYWHSKRSSAFLQVLKAQVGDKYVYGAEVKLDGGDRSNPNTFDCSELVQWACNYVGVYIPDGSGQQLAYCNSKGKGITVSEARRIPGALMYKGYYGSTHVAVSLGGGRVVEAANPRAGVRIGSSAGSDWSAASLIPGMKYDFNIKGASIN